MPSTTIVNLQQETPVIIKVQQGNTILLPLIFKDEAGTPLNFTGYSVTGQFRSDYVDDDGELIVDLTQTPDVLNNYVSLTPLDGRVDVRIDQSITETRSSRQKSYLEVKLLSGLGNVTVYFIARIKFSKRVID